jgi:hypothetical protein
VQFHLTKISSHKKDFYKKIKLQKYPQLIFKKNIKMNNIKTLKSFFSTVSGNLFTWGKSTNALGYAVSS